MNNTKNFYFNIRANEGLVKYLNLTGPVKTYPADIKWWKPVADATVTVKQNIVRSSR